MKKIAFVKEIVSSCIDSHRLKVRAFLRYFTTFLLVYSIIFQTLFISVPRVAARPVSRQNTDHSDQGYVSNVASRIAQFFAGKNVEPENLESTEIASPDVTAVAFGPKRFNRTNGAPNNYVETFTIPTNCLNGIYKLIILNGTSSGSNRISSAVIKLNGVEIFAQSDFNQNVYRLERAATLSAQNTLEIRLASSPGSYLTIEMRGENCGYADNVPPSIVITSPADNTATINETMTIRGTAEDGGNNPSGIAQVFVNDVSVPYNATNKTWELASASLNTGANLFTAKAVDNAGNEATSQVSIIRDLTNPGISIISPANNTITLAEAITITGNASDVGGDASGIATVKVNGVDAVVDLQTGNWSLSPASLNVGNNTFTATATDRAGNQASSQIVVRRVVNQPPTANAGGDQTIELPNPANLTGAASDDGYPFGSALAAVWSKVSGDGNVVFANPNAAQTPASFSSSGIYVLRLTATDGQLFASDDVIITVQPENQSPTVSAGEDRTIELPNTVSLSGTASDDGYPVGSNLSVQWSKVSGDGDVAFTNPNNQQTAVSFSTRGNYVLRLTASDGALSSSDDLLVTVHPVNQAPAVTAGADQTIDLPNSANLSGTASDDGYPLGSSLSVSWSKVSGDGNVLFASPTAAQTSASFSSSGIYVLRITATDGQLSASGELTVTVLSDTQAPTLQVTSPANNSETYDSTITLSGTAIDEGLNASGVNQVTVNGQAAAYNGATGQWVLTNVPINVGENDFAVIAKDNAAIPNQTQVNWRVIRREIPPPTISLSTPADNLTTAEESVSVAGMASAFNLGNNQITDVTVNGTPASYEPASGTWILNSISLAVGENVLIARAVDTGGRQAMAQITVFRNTVNQSPTVEAGENQTITLSGSANLNASVGDDGRPDNVLTVSWSVVSGNGTVAFANANSAQTTVSFNAAGTYVLGVTASDGVLAESDDITITVNPGNPSNQPPVVNAGEDKIAALPTGSFQFVQNNLALFNQIASNPSLGIDFDTIPAGTNITGTTINGILFEKGNSPAPSAPLIVVKGSDTYTTGGFSGVPNPATNKLIPAAGENVLSPGGVELAPGSNLLKENDDIKMTFEQPVAAVGFDILFQSLDFYSAVGVKIYDSQGNILYQNANLPVSTTNGGGAPGGREFFGFVSRRSNIKTILIDEYDGDNINPDCNIGIVGVRVKKILPNGFVSLNGSISDDGLPNGVLTADWSKVSGPGTATFSNNSSPTSQVTFSQAGTYILRLSASDGELQSFDEVKIAAYENGQQPANQAPNVNVGSDQTITLPNSINLFGIVTDDGLPAGSSVAVSWSQVSGPGVVVFTNSNASATTVSFSATGIFVLKLTATDSLLTGADEIVVTVNQVTPTPTITPTPSVTPTPQNQPPTANSGDDRTATLKENLLQNGSGELALAGDERPAWMEVSGNTWTVLPGGAGNVPPARFGSYVVSPGTAANAELAQNIDVRGYAESINAGTRQFTWQGYVRSVAESAPDRGRIIIEYRDVNNQSIIATLDSGQFASTEAWTLIRDTRVPPAGTGFIRFRLIATRNTGTTNDVFFDGLSLKANGNVSAFKLGGTVTDDGLPSENTLQKIWAKVSGPGSVLFGNASEADSSVVFDTAGTYVLRLTANDGEFLTSDEVIVTVIAGNTAPVVNAGLDSAAIVNSQLQVNGAANDDGYPQPFSIRMRWEKVSGPGAVSINNSRILNPIVSFAMTGTYVLRLTAEDGEFEASDEVTITVNPQGGGQNQAPAVEAGNNQAVTLPANSAALNGTATDDGLPNNSLTIAWTKTSGQGNVTFANPNSAQTTATFGTAGSYVLRLTASDGQYTVFDEVAILVNPQGSQNQPPTVVIGADQTIALTQTAILEALFLQDDGLPVGGSYTYQWSKVSGSGNVAFTNPIETATYATFSQTGVYVIRLTASDSELTGSDDVTVTVVENQPAPTVEILTPEDGLSITEPTAITGTVSGGDWKLEHSLTDTDNANNRVWTSFATGTGAASGSLGNLDTTLMLNGLYEVRLTTTNQYGQISTDTITVSVENNLKVGHFTVSFEDMNVPVAGIPIQVIRTYDSRDKRRGDFGIGWTLGIKNIRVEKNRTIGLNWRQVSNGALFPTYCVEATRPHIVTVTMPDGTVEKFEARLQQMCQQYAPIDFGYVTFAAQTGTRGKLEVLGDNYIAVAGSVPGPVEFVGFDGQGIFDRSQFKYTSKDGTEFVINQGGGLQSVRDLDNNTLTISAGGIVHSSGKSISFTRDSLGRITNATDPNGVSNVYAYDANGDLISYKDRENNTTAFTYEPTIPHHLKSIVDPLGRTPIRNEYDASGRLLKHTDANGDEINYIHNLAARVETVSDRLGNQTIFNYDSRGNVLQKTDALGNQTSFVYDANDNVLTGPGRRHTR